MAEEVTSIFSHFCNKIQVPVKEMQLKTIKVITFKISPLISHILYPDKVTKRK